MNVSTILEGEPQRTGTNRDKAGRDAQDLYIKSKGTLIDEDRLGDKEMNRLTVLCKNVWTIEPTVFTKQKWFKYAYSKTNEVTNNYSVHTTT